METDEKQPRIRRIALTASAVGMAGLMAVAGAVVGRSTAGSGDSTTTSSTWQTWPGWSGQGRSWSGGPMGGGSPYGWEGAGGRQAQGRDQGLAITAATAQQQRGLVRIVARSRYAGSTAAGTGMVLTPEGEVVTNNHVVADATRIRATVVATGKSYAVRLLGTDKADDVAVLQLVSASGVQPVSTDTANVSTGDPVSAVGDAEGARRLSSAAGTVAGLHRSITTGNAGGTDSERLRGLIEVDADVVSGDSGGPLLDSGGDVVGMTTAASTGTGNITGYAIPIAKVLRIVGQVDAGIETARVRIGYDAFLGVELAPGPGTTVMGVLAGTPARRAGLAPGDRITAVDGRSVNTGAALRKAIATHQPGDVVRVRWTDPTGVRHTAGAVLVTAPVN